MTAVSRSRESGDKFLAALWHRRTGEEEKSPEERATERALDIYLDIKNAVDGYRGEKRQRQTLLDQMKEVDKSIIRYDATRAQLAIVRLEEQDTETVQEADTRRRAAHEALVDNLDILSRLFKQAGLDSQWRVSIGLNREVVGDWASLVANAVSIKVMEEQSGSKSKDRRVQR